MGAMMTLLCSAIEPGIMYGITFIYYVLLHMNRAIFTL